MKCPHCALENPESALRCDCGYDFASGKMASSYLAASKEERASRQHASTGTRTNRLALLVLLPFAGVLFLGSVDVLDFEGMGMLLFVPAAAISLGMQALGLGGLTGIFVTVRDGFPILGPIGILVVYVAPPVLLFRVLRRNASGGG
jgi:hypothetical protein